MTTTTLPRAIRNRLQGRRYPSSLVGIRTRCPRCREIAPDQQGYFHGHGPYRICTPCIQELLDAPDDERQRWGRGPHQPSPSERYALSLIERGLSQRGLSDSRTFF